MASSKRIEFRDKKLVDFYDTNFGTDRKHLAAKIDLNRYRWLLEQELPQFEVSDAIALWSGLNGTNTSHEEMLPILQKSIASDLEGALKARVLSLSKVEWVAVIDACDRVGGGNYRVDDLASELKRVGLIR